MLKVYLYKKKWSRMTHSIYINKGWGSRRHYVSTTSDASGSSTATFEAFTRSWRCRGKVDFVGKPSCVTVVPCASNAECRKSRFTRRRPCQVLLKKTLCHGHHIMREALQDPRNEFLGDVLIGANVANLGIWSIAIFCQCHGHVGLSVLEM